ncbi:L-histidine N(alpha)-methyltransferase [Polynucleobacter campilacus]|uniref:L-histidine N(Alpha)-methyltransferase n=1 Tax=Polynucleobacter campilacus TaxID=1743163 RepID=A0A254PX53_9BURK|nr:L-histidine N(alpha)-methyltransferase [Polynucleobacter campilacus]OWS71115.1 L-histidine N(alpha)-methyltransferase [Polynucleobacter campilacus]
MKIPIGSDDQSTVQNDLAHEIEIGLLAQSAWISPKFLYDPLGSHLFTAITLLPEYYPSTTEKNIFTQYRDQITAAVGIGGTLIDLGAGNCQKAESFFGTLKPSSYLAIDFSAEYLQDAVTKLQGKYPHIDIQGIGMDFSKEIIIPSSINTAKRTFFYPGSSIGNFSNNEAIKLLSQVKSQAKDGGLLIGVDLMKEDSVLMAAYDDPLKVTAAFNLNILRSINSHLGSNFRVEQFRHIVKINHAENMVELYLQALEDLTVSWPANSRVFKRGDLIHTENSHKYTIESIKQLLKNAGFEKTQIWTDPKNYFAVIYAR